MNVDAFGRGDTTGALAATAVAAALCVVLFVLSRRAPVTAANVNDAEKLPLRRLNEREWSGALAA